MGKGSPGPQRPCHGVQAKGAVRKSDARPPRRSRWAPSDRRTTAQSRCPRSLTCMEGLRSRARLTADALAAASVARAVFNARGARAAMWKAARRSTDGATGERLRDPNADRRTPRQTRRALVFACCCSPAAAARSSGHSNTSVCRADAAQRRLPAADRHGATHRRPLGRHHHGGRHRRGHARLTPIDSVALVDSCMETVSERARTPVRERSRLQPAAR